MYHKRELEYFHFDQDTGMQSRPGTRTWFGKEAYKALSKMDPYLVLNQPDAIKTPAILTTDFAYIRLIGDRSIDVKD